MKLNILRKIIIICCLALVILGIFKIRDKNLYTGYTYNIQPQVEVLNQFLSERYGNKYKLYTAYFNSNEDVPDIGQYNENAILWLGAKKIPITRQALDNIKKFGFVLVSDFNKRSLVKIIGVANVAQFPVFYDHQEIKKKGNYYILLGNPIYAKNLLKKEHLPYKVYDFAQINELRKELENIKAIIIEQENNDSYDMEPILLEALSNEIPIIEQKNQKGSSSQALVGLNIEYYYSQDELENILQKVEKQRINTKQKANWVHHYFNKEAALARLEEILNNQSPEYVKNLIDWDTHDYTGYHISGDTWLIKDLLQKMDKNNFHHFITFRDSLFRPNADISIFIRGKTDDITDKIINRQHVLWLAYPDVNNKKTNEVTTSFTDYIDDIIKISPYFMKIAVSSKKIQKALKEKGLDVLWIPQFTNTEKFYPDYDETKTSEVLFVGNYHFNRKSAVYAKKNNLPITIYGNWWPKGWAKADYIDNRILRKYYSSAKIVLSDQLKSMTEFGVIVNRIYDVSACNTLVISEYVSEIEEAYGDCVPMWKTEEEFVSLIKYYLTHDEERKQKAQCAYDITLKNFTTDIIAEKFNKIIEELK